MATLEENIAAIRTARYGRQVRSAIADSLDQVHDEYANIKTQDLETYDRFSTMYAFTPYEHKHKTDNSSLGNTQWGIYRNLSTVADYKNNKYGHSNAWATMTFACHEGEEFRYIGIGKWDVASYAFLASDGSLISEGQKDGLTNPVYVSAPKGSYLAVFSSPIETTPFVFINESFYNSDYGIPYSSFPINQVITGFVNKQNVDSTDSFLNGTDPVLSNHEYVPHIRADSGYGIMSYTCYPGQKFYYKSKSIYDVAGITWLDMHGRIISQDVASNGASQKAIVIAPDKARFVLFSGAIEYAPFGYPAFMNQSRSPLAGKTLALYGDSFIAADRYRFAKDIDYDVNVNIKCYAVSGQWLVDYKEGDDSHVFSRNIDSMDTSADYFLLSWGLNEEEVINSHLGDKNSSGNDTLWGAYKKVLEKIFTSNPKAKVGIVLWDAWAGKKYSDAVHEIAKYCGVPVLDFKYDDNVSIRILTDDERDVDPIIKKAKYDAFANSASDAHPNDAGHDYVAPRIRQFLESL